MYFCLSTKWNNSAVIAVYDMAFGVHSVAHHCVHHHIVSEKTDGGRDGRIATIALGLFPTEQHFALLNTLFTHGFESPPKDKMLRVILNCYTESSNVSCFNNMIFPVDIKVTKKIRVKGLRFPCLVYKLRRKEVTSSCALVFLLRNYIFTSDQL